MESEARYTLVGTVMLILLAGLIVAVLWLAQWGYDQKYAYYTIYFRHQSLDGLQTNSDVKMKGIKVGVVTHFAIAAKNVAWVKVTVKLEADTPVRENTQAVVQRNILTGLATINLTHTTQASRPLTKILADEQYPVIAEGHSMLKEVEESLPEIVRQTSEVLSRLTLLLSEENRQAVHETLANLASLTDTLTQREADMGKTIENVRQAANQLKILGATLTTAVHNTDRRLGEVSQTLVVTLRQITNSVQSLTDTGMLELQAVAQELRSSAQRLSVTLEKYHDPGALLFGPDKRQLGPGEQFP
jgi:phospholipid/cholesterol/gamma-HCH transport system substrate-binding protein